MASGLSSRFGSNKLMADFHGEPMICQALHATEGLFTKRVVVTRYEEIAALCKRYAVDVLLHNLPSRSDTVQLGIGAISPSDACLFLPGDQPLLSRGTIKELINAAKNARECIWRTESNGIPGAPVLFPSWAFGELLSLPDGKGGNYLIRKYPESVRMLHVLDPFELMDADTPEDLEALLSR